MTTDDKDLIEFYRDTVLQHSREPHNFRRLAAADLEATGHNPLCGDKLTVYVDLGHDAIKEVAFEGSGCAISLASASIMTDTIAGLDEAKARDRIAAVMREFASRDDQDDSDEAVTELGAMAALRGVRRYPSRIKCATLAWKTLAAALDKENCPVSTEGTDTRA
jgi:nitrogen fixation NifU-like protein